MICFSVKSNSNLTLLKELKKIGSGADVVSAGELLKVIKAGIKPKKIVFSGVGKTEDEIKLAIKKGVLLINMESMGTTLQAVDRILLSKGKQLITSDDRGLGNHLLSSGNILKIGLL